MDFPFFLVVHPDLVLRNFLLDLDDGAAQLKKNILRRATWQGIRDVIRGSTIPLLAGDVNLGLGYDIAGHLICDRNSTQDAV